MTGVDHVVAPSSSASLSREATLSTPMMGWAPTMRARHDRRKATPPVPKTAMLAPAGTLSEFHHGACTGLHAAPERGRISRGRCFGTSPDCVPSQDVGRKRGLSEKVTPHEAAAQCIAAVGTVKPKFIS